MTTETKDLHDLVGSILGYLDGVDSSNDLMIAALKVAAATIEERQNAQQRVMSTDALNKYLRKRL